MITKEKLIGLIGEQLERMKNAATESISVNDLSIIIQAIKSIQSNPDNVDSIIDSIDELKDRYMISEWLSNDLSFICDILCAFMEG
jgi:hypothetical protein